MSDGVGDYLDCQVLSVTDGFVTSLAVRYDVRKLEGFGEPRAVLLAIQFDGQIQLPRAGGGCGGGAI